MKKFKYIAGAILAGIASGGALAGDASALKVVSGVNYYNFWDGMEISAEMEETAVARCGDDGECRRSVYQQLINSDSKYRAANTLTGGYTLMFTHINPEKSEISFLFNGRLMYYYRKLNDAQWYPTRITIAYADVEAEEYYNKTNNIYTDLLARDESRGMHIIFDEEGSAEDPVLMPDTEVTLADFRWNLSDKAKKIYFVVSGTDGCTYSGYYNYSDCLSQDDYYDGATCETMSSGYSFISLPEPKEVVEVEKEVIVEKEVVIEKEVEVPVEVEKIVEVPVEVEKIVEVEKVVEVKKEVEVPVEVIVEKEVEKIVEVEKEVEVPVEVEKVVEVEKIVEVPVEVEKEVAVEKVVEKEVPVEVVVEKEVEKIVEVPVEKVVEKEVVVEAECEEGNLWGQTLGIAGVLAAIDAGILWWFWPAKRQNKMKK